MNAMRGTTVRRGAAACRYLILAALAFPLAAHASADIPQIDAEATCRSAARADPATAQQVNASCVRSEHAARDALVAGWDEFRAPDRAYCARLATMAGKGSYVQLLTCLEMERDVRALRQRARENATTTGSRE